MNIINDVKYRVASDDLQDKLLDTRYLFFLSLK